MGAEIDRIGQRTLRVALRASSFEQLQAIEPCQKLQIPLATISENYECKKYSKERDFKRKFGRLKILERLPSFRYF